MDEQGRAHELPVSAAEMLASVLRELADRMHELDPLVRAGAEESVHDLRVAVRRLRSTLASYAPAFVPEETEDLRAELQWFGARLGDVRDPEVQTRRLRDLGHAGSSLHARLDDAHTTARASLLEAMEGSRYAALLTRLDGFADDPPFTSAARAPAADLVRARAHKDWRRVLDRVSGLPEARHGDYTEQLHEVRKSAKRLQYVLESGRAVAGDEAERLRRRLTKFQRRLGDHHDATLTHDLLAEAGEPSAKPEQEAAAVAEEFPTMWRRLSARARRWLH